VSKHQARKRSWEAPIYHLEGPVSYIRSDVAAQRVADAYEAGVVDLGEVLRRERIRLAEAAE